MQSCQNFKQAGVQTILSVIGKVKHFNYQVILLFYRGYIIQGYINKGFTFCRWVLWIFTPSHQSQVIAPEQHFNVMNATISKICLKYKSKHLNMY